MNVAVLDIELAAGLEDVAGLEAFDRAHVLVRYRRVPFARFELPVQQGRISAVKIWSAAEKNCSSELKRTIVRDLVFGIEPVVPAPLPPCSVVLCTRDRPEDVRRCLEATVPMLGDDVEMIVVDNDPPDDRTREVAQQYPVHYCRQPRRGLNWARALGIRLAQHELVLLVDDDVKVDSNWLDELRKPFADPLVGAVTGAVEPLELSTQHQYLHEQFGGFYRGFTRRVFHSGNWPPAAAGSIGAGASMAIRRNLAVEHALFETELDAGTASKSGGDVYAMYKILRAGYSIVYTPTALAWHRHRKTHDHLEHMLHGYSVGSYCVLLSALLREKDLDAAVIGLAWFYQHHLRELWKTLRRRPGARPWPLIKAEIKGVFDAPLAYFRCRRRERAVGPLAAEPISSGL